MGGDIRISLFWYAAIVLCKWVGSVQSGLKSFCSRVLLVYVSVWFGLGRPNLKKISQTHVKNHGPDPSGPKRDRSDLILSGPTGGPVRQVIR